MARRRADRRAAPGVAAASLTRRPARRRWLIASLALIAAVVVGAGIWQLAESMKAAQLPPVPDLSRQPSLVGDHLRSRRDDAAAQPRSPAAVGAYCLALHADMFYDDAQRCYAIVERLEPNNWRWLYYDALIRGERGGGAEFADVLHRVVTIVPQFAPAWWWLGEAAFKEGRYDEAADAWRRAEAAPEPDRRAEPPARTVEIPLKAYASLGVARIAMARNDADAARSILERLTGEVPRFGAAFRLLGDSDEALGRSQEAVRARDRANQLPPYAPYADPLVDALAEESRNSTFLLRQASEADLAMNASWSEHLVRRALESDPENPDALAKLGRVLRNVGRNEEALEYFLAFNRRVPGDYLGLANIGTCLADLRRVDEAEQYLRRALEGIDDAETHYNLGVVLAAKNQLDEAIAEYRRALERDPLRLDARNNLAVALARQGRVAQAAAEWQRVLAADPGNQIARTNLDAIRGLAR